MLSVQLSEGSMSSSYVKQMMSGMTVNSKEIELRWQTSAWHETQMMTTMIARYFCCFML